MKGYPKVIYLKWDASGDDEPWIEVGQTPADLSEHDSSVSVGVYTLTEMVNLVNKTEVKKK